MLKHEEMLTMEPTLSRITERGVNVAIEQWKSTPTAEAGKQLWEGQFAESALETQA